MLLWLPPLLVRRVELIVELTLPLLVHSCYRSPRLYLTFSFRKNSSVNVNFIDIHWRWNPYCFLLLPLWVWHGSNWFILLPSVFGNLCKLVRGQLTWLRRIWFLCFHIDHINIKNSLGALQLLKIHLTRLLNSVKFSPKRNPHNSPSPQTPFSPLQL